VNEIQYEHEVSSAVESNICNPLGDYSSNGSITHDLTNFISFYCHQRLMIKTVVAFGKQSLEVNKRRTVLHNDSDLSKFSVEDIIYFIVLHLYTDIILIALPNNLKCLFFSYQIRRIFACSMSALGILVPTTAFSAICLKCCSAVPIKYYIAIAL